jgi:hypothetical protein
MACRETNLGRAVVSKAIATLWWSFLRGGQEKEKTRPRRGRKIGTSSMIFTGSLIQDLIATVERAERLREVSSRSGAIAMTMTMTMTEAAASGEPSPLEDAFPEVWLTSVEQNTNYDPKLLGVA